jgi:hypothetical protein
MRYLNGLVSGNTRNTSLALESKKSKLINICEVENKKEKKICKDNQLKYNKTSNLMFILFSCIFLGNKSNALNFDGKSNTPSSHVVVDGNLLNIKREDIFNEKFLFSNRTTQNTEIESEIEEIEDDEFRYSAWKNSQVGLTVGGSALSMWFAYKGLNVWEKWMKDQEQKDIEEEIEMTGTYINPGAGNVEASIDPITGKKIEIKPKKNDDENKNKSN